MRHALQREYGIKMMQIGMVMTAYKHFFALSMWDLSVECLLAAGRRAQAIAVIDALLGELSPGAGGVVLKGRKSSSGEAEDGGEKDDESAGCSWEVPSLTEELAPFAKCKLLCQLGNLARDGNVDDNLAYSSEDYYHQAWYLSGERCTLAMRCLGNEYWTRATEEQKHHEQLRSAGEEQHSASDVEGTVLYFIGQAAKCYERALKINPNFPKAHFQLGYCYKRMNKLEKAIAAFGKCLEYGSVSVSEGEESKINLAASCYKLLAQCYSDQERVKDAMHCITQAARRAPMQFDVWQNFLQISLASGNNLGLLRGVRKFLLDFKRPVVGAVFGVIAQYSLPYFEHPGDMDNALGSGEGGRPSNVFDGALATLKHLGENADATLLEPCLLRASFWMQRCSSSSSSSGQFSKEQSLEAQMAFLLKEFRLLKDKWDDPTLKLTRANPKVSFFLEEISTAGGDQAMFIFPVV